MSLLRGKRLAKMDIEALKFTASAEKDAPLIDSVVKINLAHVLTMYKAKLIDSEQALKIVTALKSIPKDFELDTTLEDVHMNVESFVLRKAKTAGGMINLGKSRNDQVSTALRMVARDYTLSLTHEIIQTVEILIQKARNHGLVLMPGYTHLQIAQPTTVAHYLTCYAEALVRDGQRLKDLYSRINLSPMGSAALAGSTLPLKRDVVARLLGFDGLLKNTMDAVSTRDFLLEFLSATMIIQINLSRMAEDIIFYSTQECRYVSIHDKFASTSSMMPQKKNAVVFEIVRAKAANMIGMLCAAASNLKGLPQAYNLDLQELNSMVWVAGDNVIDSLRLVGRIIKGLSFDENELSRGSNTGYSVATDLAEMICVRGKIPFRDAHHIVGAAIGKSNNNLEYRDLRKMIIQEAISLGYKGVEKLVPTTYDATESVKNKKSYGSPNPIFIDSILKDLTEDVGQLKMWLNKKYESLRKSATELEKELQQLEKEVRKTGV
jgi:argininosuccinate lyase